MNNSHKRQDKDNQFSDQLKVVSTYWAKNTATMKMVSVATGIDRANICRYVATLRKQDRIKKIETKLCQITGFSAGYYSTEKGGEKC